MVIALVVTPQGFPLAYEVMPGNTSDKTTLKDFLAQIEAQYGRSDRVWIMDRAIPTEETLEQMRTGDSSPVHYLVGTPKGRLSKFEKKFLALPWQPYARRSTSSSCPTTRSSTSWLEAIPEPQRTRDATPALEKALATPPRATTTIPHPR